MAASATLVDSLNAVEAGSSDEFDDVWIPMSRQLIRTSMQASTAPDIEYLRVSFHSLSEEIVRALQIFGNPHDEELRLAYCPMASDQEGAPWLLLGDKIENPYFGATMYRCGEILESVAVGQYLSREEEPVD